MLVRVNDYSPILNEAGARVIQATGHGVRVNPSQIINVSTAAVVGLEEDGETEIDVFRVRFNGGTQIWTDGDGITAINAWLFPIELAPDAEPA
jgi:hypothetical protein